MKIGILTQPLQSNYGGILQNWALQQVLIKLGHEPITIDFMPRERLLKTHIKFLFQYAIGKRAHYPHLYKIRTPLFAEFIEKNIIKTVVVHKLKTSIIKQYKLDALIVGSDQVWRPCYNVGCLENMYFDFVKHKNIIRLSYASSFGSDVWEYTRQQTEKCSYLIRLFDGISVREKRGKDFCADFFNVNASIVLDPTLLLDKVAYLQLTKHTPRYCNEPFLAAYILDVSDDLIHHIDIKAKDLNLRPVYFSADEKSEHSIAEWLSMFRDADYIITNSFHGSVFSLIFGKDFEFISNEERGGSRFEIIKKLQQKFDLSSYVDESIDFLRSHLGNNKC